MIPTHEAEAAVALAGNRQQRWALSQSMVPWDFGDFLVSRSVLGLGTRRVLRGVVFRQ